jgi:nitrogen regulatory protein P-II 1
MVNARRRRRRRGGKEASGLLEVLGLFSWTDGEGHGDQNDASERANTERRKQMSFVKVEAVVIRERIETVIDAVEEQAGHVGVTVIEAVGHGRQRGITHEYRGRVFESRFLPKALLVFVAEATKAGSIAGAIADAARSGNESGDGIVWTTPVDNVTHNRTGNPLEEVE